ncbi:SDH family Clp fold serine proteinase [Candidatus Spongiihabitans sp.]|uniref:SDH family Clp fold serine proteinase n=1 Tax=Candidatus Spongiihabitans sp. TaxID=3101308 RepID=UPI003C6FB381
MPNLSDIRRMVTETQPQDVLRRDYLKKLNDLVKRDVILYAANFSQSAPNIPGILVSINDSDVQHLMSVISELRRASETRNDKLDLILHSPGGSLAAAEQIVCYLRKQYQYIRVIVPQNAMSAATMIACAAVDYQNCELAARIT